MAHKIILLLISLVPLLTNAHTIHWLTFIDTTDEDVGELDVNGREVLYDHFVNVINAALTEKGYKTNIQDVYGNLLTPQKCKEIVSNLNCASNDIIVFYYIGHGTHGTVGGDVWPMMAMGQHDPNYLIPLKWVHEVLKAKGAKLTLSIGMCCNSYQGIKRTTVPSFSINYGNISLTETEKEAIQQMFLEYEGDFLLTSASPGQASVGQNTPLGPMDVFTCTLVRNFEDCASEGELEWNSLFKDVKDMVNEQTDGKQTPVFAANLSKVTPPPTPAPLPTPVVIPLPSPGTGFISTNQDWLNRVGFALDNLIDIRQKENIRIAQAAELKKIFTSDAKVKVMSQDGNIVIDKSSADNFIGRLTTSRILLKVSPVDVVIKDDKISELKVKEVYKD